jgi:hypothetical protein
VWVLIPELRCCNAETARLGRELKKQEMSCGVTFPAYGARGGNRTRTLLRATDFKSASATSYDTRAYVKNIAWYFSALHLTARIIDYLVWILQAKFDDL